MNNNKTLLKGAGLLLIGLFLGWMIWGNSSVNYSSKNDMHMMPNGKMMHNMASGDDMDSMMKSMMANIDSKTGDDFDKAFLEEMIVHHKGAVVMAESVLEKSKRPELLKLANDIIKAQTGEISMMQNWLDTWFK